jgi:farnesyl-diphosphate farnesyltransferase
MAIATLAECFDNYNIFQKNVKIRKGLALRLIMQANNMEQVKKIFAEFCHVIASKLRLDDPHAFAISQALGKVDAELASCS